MGKLNRNEVGQLAPSDGLDLTHFPAVTPEATTIYRAKARGRGAWWFASVSANPDGPDGQGGRFDLVDPLGTSYWADTPGVAVRERLAHVVLRTGQVTRARVNEMQIATGRTPRNSTFADVTDDNAVKFGVSAELGTMPDYYVPQSWAAAFQEAAFSGVRYSTRFTSAGRGNAWAIFGPAEESTSLFEGTSFDATQVCLEEGIEILEDGSGAAPDEFTIITPPDDVA